MNDDRVAAAAAAAGCHTPGGSGKANWVDHLFVTTAGDAPQTADFGKVQAKVVGPVDLPSLGPDNIPNVLAQGCQADSSCWSDTLDMCEDVIADFEQLDPKKYLKSLYDELDANGMLRSGDESNFQGIPLVPHRTPGYLPDALERYRAGTPVVSSRPAGRVRRGVGW